MHILETNSCYTYIGTHDDKVRGDKIKLNKLTGLLRHEKGNSRHCNAQIQRLER